MNKFLIVLLAVCLVNVHAFVKRDTAPAAQANPVDELGKMLENFGNQIKTNLNPEKIKDELAKTFNPDKIKKDFNDLIDKVSDAVNPKQATPDAPKA